MLPFGQIRPPSGDSLCHCTAPLEHASSRVRYHRLCCCPHRPLCVCFPALCNPPHCPQRENSKANKAAEEDRIRTSRCAPPARRGGRCASRLNWTVSPTAWTTGNTGHNWLLMLAGSLLLLFPHVRSLSSIMHLHSRPALLVAAVLMVALMCATTVAAVDCQCALLFLRRARVCRLAGPAASL
jgi:hypothetical protein